jgi:hypothetical protein
MSHVLRRYRRMRAATHAIHTPCFCSIFGSERGDRPRTSPIPCQTEQVETPGPARAGYRKATAAEIKTRTNPKRECADGMEIMENTAPAPKGFNWLKLLGVLAIVGVIIAVGRIVLRVFREKRETESDTHEAG